MKRFFVFVLCGLLFWAPIGIFAEGEETNEEEETEEVVEETSNQIGPEVKATSAILIDAETGTVLARKDSDVRMDTASLSKLMSVYLATSNLKDDRQLTMSHETFESYDHTYNVIWIMENEVISAYDAEFASLVQNANDTTAMLAEALDGTQAAFVERMNTMAEELGMVNTHYENIFGLYHENQYSTAEDIAILTRTAIRNKTFKAAFGASSHRIAPTALQPNERVLAANCELLRAGDQSYDKATGCKIGYTQEGGFALSALAEKDGMQLIAVVLGEESEYACYEDARTLFDYGFREYQMISITPEDIGTKLVEVYENNKHIADVSFKVEQGFSVLMPSSIDQDALQAEIIVYNEDSSNPKDIYAEVRFTLNNEQVGTADMVKDVMPYNSGFTVKQMPQMRQLFDYFCIGVLALLLFYQVSRFFMPPQ